MGKNFLGLDGLKHFWSKAKTWIVEQITTEVTAKIAEIIAEAPENLNTLKEIADWISTHEDSASAMNTAILANKTAISGKADKSHTHTKSQITDFPTSLPANGGTATKATQDGNGNVITSTYVKKSGDTLTGPIVMKANQYTLETAQLDMKNSDIKGANAIWFDDHTEVGEGLKFPRSSGSNYDFMRLDDGKIKVAPNVTGNANTATESIVAYTSDIPTSLPANGGTADKTVNDITIYIPHVTESGQYVIPLGNILEPTSTEINSPYNWDITGFFSIIRPSGHAGSHIQFEAGHGYSHDWTTYAYLDKLDFRGVTISIKAFQYNGKWWLGLWISTKWQGYYSKMTITYSRGLPATPTCILYYSVSNGVANEEIYNSIQDIPSSWWKQRTICNPTSFSDTLYANGVIEPRLGTDNGATVSIGRSDGKITIGDINNKNSGYTTINNDCKILKALFVSGNGDMPSNFEGGCNFERDISVHSKSLFPSGYIPRTYFIERATKDNITAEQKELLRKMFAYQSVNRLIQCHGFLKYRFNTSGAYFGGTVVTVGYFDGNDWLDSNENISYDDNFSVNFACFGVQDDDDNINIVDMYNLSDNVMRNKFENLNYLLVSRLSFTVLEKK